MLKEYLLDLIAKAPPQNNGGVEVGLVFKTGQMITGFIRTKLEKKGDVLFELSTTGSMNNHGGKAVPAIISFAFEADAVERVMTAAAVDVPLVQGVSAGGIVIPS